MEKERKEVVREMDREESCKTEVAKTRQKHLQRERGTDEESVTQ